MWAHEPPGTSASLISRIGGTPLFELATLSAATGCRVLAKAEHLSPGGSVKDRVALALVRAAEASGALAPGGTVVEGTGGNTGVGLALVCAALGYRAIFTLPPKASREKVDMLLALGAQAIVCADVPFEDPAHYYHAAQALAAATPGAVWANQFESDVNRGAHESGTGPEILRQAGAAGVDALALAAGTGGTLGGLAACLRAANPRLRVFLIDPPGSSLKSFVDAGTLDASAGSTFLEGIGLNRITANFRAALPIDEAFAGSDQEALDMAYYLLRHEGVFVGPSAALNVCAAVKAARKLPPGSTVVTVLCDGGANYRSKCFSPAWLAEKGLAVGDIDSAEARAKIAFVA
jgi:cysteine synthase A